MKSLRATWASVLLALSSPGFAQYVATPPPSQSSTPSTGTASSSGVATEELHLTPRNGQSQEQQWNDRYDCHRWAKSQSGFDPTQPSGASGDNDSRRNGYRRAMTACLEGRGYTVSYGAASQAAPTPPHPPATQATRVRYDSSDLAYHPLTAQIDGGYSVAVGSTGRYLDDGSNIGLGFTWFPTASLPLGLRIDGSYSRFRARDALLNLYGGDFTSGHDNIYGGDADLQLDLAHNSSRMKMYLFGGAGWYRIQTYFRRVSFDQGYICGFYYCGPGYFPVSTAAQRTTSDWHSSWNAGLGWEIATGDYASFFVEARYLRIGSGDNKMQFVPIRVGLRF